MKVNTSQQAKILQAGLDTLREVLEQPVTVNRSQMLNIVNFEMVLTVVIEGMNKADGKSLEDLLAMREEMLKNNNLPPAGLVNN